MLLTEQIIKEIKAIENPNKLQELLAFIRSLRAKNQESIGNKLKRHAGKIDNAEAANITQLVNEEFSRIEGDW